MLFNITSVQEKAHLADLNTKAHREVSFPLGLGVSGFGNQNVCVLGESSKPPMESLVPEAPTVGGSSFSNSDQASEIPTPIPSRVIGYPVADNASPPCGSSDAVVLTSVKEVFSMGSASGAETTLGLGGNPMFSGSWCWFRTLQKELK